MHCFSCCSSTGKNTWWAVSSIEVGLFCRAVMSGMTKCSTKWLMCAGIVRLSLEHDWCRWCPFSYFEQLLYCVIFSSEVTCGLVCASAGCVSGRRHSAGSQAVILEKWSTRRPTSPNIPVLFCVTAARLKDTVAYSQTSHKHKQINVPEMYVYFAFYIFFKVWAFWLHLKWLKKKRRNLYCILINCRLICRHHKANWKSSLKIVENIWWSIWCVFFPALHFYHTAATCCFKRVKQTALC